ncbi:hypothetical protein T484DRAFT_1920081 [Baffinella frigidus]|nr:hypothetical protein T484DRAFT_1920081 [Cryptophyta sp. CCMP2293]
MARWRATASGGLGLALVAAACVLWASDEGPQRTDALLSAVPFFVSSSNGAQLQTSYGGAQQLPGGGSVSFAAPQQAAQLQALDYRDGIQQGLRSAVNAQGLAYAPTIEQGFVPQNLESSQPTIEQGFVPESLAPTIEQGFEPDAPAPESVANAPLVQQRFYQPAAQQPLVQNGVAPVLQPQFQGQPQQQMRFLPQYAPAPQYAAAAQPNQRMTRLPPAQPQAQPEIYVSAGDLRTAPRGALFPEQFNMAAQPEQAAQPPAQPATPAQLPTNQQQPALQPAQQMAPQQEQPLAYLPPAQAPAPSVPSYLNVQAMPALHGLAPLPPTPGASAQVQGMQEVQSQGEEWQQPVPLSVAAERAGAAEKAEAAARAEAAREQAGRQAREQAAQQALQVAQEQNLQRQEELRAQQAASALAQQQAAVAAHPQRQPAAQDTGRVAELEGEVAALRRGKARAVAALQRRQAMQSQRVQRQGVQSQGVQQGQALVQGHTQEAQEGGKVEEGGDGGKVAEGGEVEEGQKAGAAEQKVGEEKMAAAGEEQVAAAGEKAAAEGAERVHQDLRLAEETDRNAVGILAQEMEREKLIDSGEYRIMYARCAPAA